MSYPLVFQALPKWDAPYNSTSLTVAKLLSKSRRVFYVEHPFSWLDSFRSHTKEQRVKRSRKLFEQPFEDFPDFYVIHPPRILPINALSEGAVYQSLLNLYKKQLWNRIDWVLDVFGIKKFGYVNSFDPVFFDFKTSHNCIFKLYHCVDLIEGESYIAKHGATAEEEACKKADVVITTSKPLRQKLQVYNANTECIVNASDFDHFYEKRERPIEYADSDKERIVYTGSLGHRIDYNLIKTIALENPDKEVILIGPKHPKYFKGQELEGISNIQFLGPRKYEDLPAYIQYADVLLIPFLKNELTHHIYPLKINEYLATGKPIVSTKFTDLSEFNGLIEIIENNESSSAVLKSAVDNNSQRLHSQRIKFSSKNTWHHRLKDWKAIISSLEVKSFID